MAEDASIAEMGRQFKRRWMGCGKSSAMVFNGPTNPRKFGEQLAR
jgi:hypothetical protein